MHLFLKTSSFVASKYYSVVGDIMAILKAHNSFLKANGKILVKNDGGSEIIYGTNFENFDFANKIDYPYIGNPKGFQFNVNYFEKTSVIIDGVSYPAIKHKNGNSAELRAVFNEELENENIYTVEFDLFKPSFNGLGGTCFTYGTNNWVGKWAASPIINCYKSNRGYGIGARNISGITLFNDFYFAYEFFYFSNSTKSISGICTGGTTFDKVNGKVKVYLKGKKALSGNIVPIDNYDTRFYSDSNMELYLLGLRIYRKDRFEEME